MNLDPLILAELQRGGPPLWTSGRTYMRGTVARSGTNLQPYVRTATGAGTTDPSADPDNWLRWNKSIEDALAGVGTAVGNLGNAVAGVATKVDAVKAVADGLNSKGAVKLVQRGFAQISSFQTQNENTPGMYVNVAISPVNTAKSTINLPSLGWGHYQTSAIWMARAFLASASVLRIEGTYSFPHPLAWEVVEFY